MRTAAVANPSPTRRPRPSLLAVALVLDLVFAGLLAAVLVLVRTGQEGGDSFFANPTLAFLALGAAAAAVAGGVVAAVALVRDPPVSRAGRIAAIAPLLPIALFAAGGVAAALGVEPDTAFAPAQLGLFVLAVAALVGGVAGAVRGYPRALLAIPVVVGVLVALFVVGELMGHD